MSKLLDKDQLVASAKFAPRVRYNVLYNDSDLGWTNADKLGMGKDFHSLDDAKSTLHLLDWERSPIETMLVKSMTVYFSDLQTRELHSLTEFGAMLV